MDAAKDREARRRETLAEQARVLHVELDLRVGLREAGGRVRRRRTLLHDVRRAIELRGVASRPQRIERDSLALGIETGDAFRHDHERAAQAGEARALREAAQLQRDLLRPRDLVDRARQRRIRDVRLVRGVEQDHRIGLLGPRDPARELLARRDRAGRIVRRAEVSNIDRGARRLGLEAVRFVADEVREAGIPTIGTGRIGATCHHVRIDVNRIDRIGDRDLRGMREDLLDVAAIALAAIADEDLVGRDVDAAHLVVIRADRFDEKIVTLLGTVAAERLARAHLVDRGVHRFEDRGSEGLGDIADAEANDFRVRMRRRETAHAAPDLGEEVARRKFCVVLVYSHGGNVAESFDARDRSSVASEQLVATMWRCTFSARDARDGHRHAGALDVPTRVGRHRRDRGRADHTRSGP